MTPTSVQPGGVGWCGQAELAWARWRRAWLRCCRPGYVRRMAEKRQGRCEACPHDVIDSRDLKYCRNVCGYWFRPEDDPFRWREHLGLARAGLAELVIGTLLFLAVVVPLSVAASAWHAALWIPVTALTVVWLWMVSFFRDPTRRPCSAPPTAR